MFRAVFLPLLALRRREKKKGPKKIPLFFFHFFGFDNDVSVADVCGVSFFFGSYGFQSSSVDLQTVHYSLMYSHTQHLRTKHFFLAPKRGFA